MSYLENLTITIIGQPVDSLAKSIHDSVKSGGGIFDKNGVTKDTTHAILVGSQSKYLQEIAKAVENGAAVVQPRWLEVCSIHGQCIPVQPFKMMPGPSPLFSDMTFTASGLNKDDKIKLAALVTFHGGKFTRALTKDTTHLVTHKPVGEKYDKALKTDYIKRVTPGWVLTSAKSRALKNTTDYDPANVIPGSELLPDSAATQLTLPSNSSQPVISNQSQSKAPQKAKAIRRKRSPNSEKRPRSKSTSKKNPQNQSGGTNSTQKVVKITTPVSTIAPPNQVLSGLSKIDYKPPPPPALSMTMPSQPSSSPMPGQIIQSCHLSAPTSVTPQFIVVSSSGQHMTSQVIPQSTSVDKMGHPGQTIVSTSHGMPGQIINSNHQRVLSVPMIPSSQTSGQPHSPMFIRPVQTFPGNPVQMITPNGAQLIQGPITQHQGQNQVPQQATQIIDPSRQIIQGQMVVNQGIITQPNSIISHQGQSGIIQQPNGSSQLVQTLPPGQGHQIVVQHPSSSGEVQMLPGQGQITPPGVKLQHQPMMVNQYRSVPTDAMGQFQRQAIPSNFQHGPMPLQANLQSPRSPLVNHQRRLLKPLLVPSSCPEEELHQAIKNEHHYETIDENAEICPKYLCFIGCVFYFAPDVKRITKEDHAFRLANWKMKIQLHGGLVEDTYNKVTCTHLVSEDSDTDDVKTALSDSKRCVSVIWIDWCLEKRKMNPPRCLLHVPTPGSAKTFLKDKFRVSTSHFQPKTKDYVKYGLNRLGVTITKMLYKDTDMLIVPKPLGDKYNTAIYHETPCVSLLWLRDALLGSSDAFDGGWKEDNYKVMDGSKGVLALCLNDHYDFDEMMMEAWTKPIKIESDFELRAKLKRDFAPNSNANDGAPESKRQKVIYRMTPRVMLTGFMPQETKDLADKIKAVGGEMATSDTGMTHLVAKEFRRTVKWYCAMHTAKYVVTPDWVNESYNSKWFLDEDKFWLTDPRKESIFGFRIRDSIEKAREKDRVFAGYRFALLTDKIIPSAEILEHIIRAGGGRFLTNMPSIKSLLTVKKQREEDPRSCWPVIVIANGDKSCMDHVRLLRDSQLHCYTPEIILNASVKQRLEFPPFMINPPSNQIPR